MISEFTHVDLQWHGRCSSPPVSWPEPPLTTETDIVTTLEIGRLDPYGAIHVADTTQESDPPFEPSNIAQDGLQTFVPPALIRDEDYDDDAESFITASTFCEDLEKRLPNSKQVDHQIEADKDEDFSELKGVAAKEVMEDCPNCESSAAILTIKEDTEIKQETAQGTAQTCASSPAVSFAEVAIRVASPFLPQWMTSPSLLSSTCAYSHSDGITQQVHSSLELQGKALELAAPPKHVHGDRRRMDQERHLDGEITIHTCPTVPPPPVSTLDPLESYWNILPSVRSVSMDTDQEVSALYEGSIRSSRTYGASSLLSTRVRMEDVDESDCEDRPRQGVESPRRAVRFSFPPSSDHHHHHHQHSRSDHHRIHGSAGAEAVEQISTFMMSTGKAAFGYLVESVVPTTIDLAHRSATTTLEAINAGLQLPGAIFQNTVLPRFFHYHPHSSSPSSHEPLGNPQDDLQSSYNRSAHFRAASAPEMLGLHIRNSAGHGPVVPESVHLRDHYLSTTNPGTIFQNPTASERPRPQPRQKRRYPLQTIPGPDGLDPHIRRELEAQGLASLGLRDGTEGRDWRNWWDPRRYGLPKYVICHELRTPRPCTLILLTILVVCIVRK